MNQHNFNFSNISVSNKVKKEQAIVVTFTSNEDGVTVPDIVPKELIPLLDKNTVSVFYNSIYYVLVNAKDDSAKSEKLVISAIASIPKNIQDIAVFIDGFKIKKFVSNLLVSTSNKWNVKSEQDIGIPKNITLVTNNSLISEVQSLVSSAIHLAEAMATKIRLIEQPSNYLTPSALVEEGRKIAALSDLTTVSLVSGKELQEQGYGSLYAVSKGSIEDGHLLTIEYKGGKKDEAPIVLVGKGLTFDSGGISIKPSRGMGRMKGDMGGAATVLCSLMYAINTKVKKNIVAIIATCENMPDAAALKPGDIITAKNGKTIEVEDTDAEGRLVLADALCHAQTFNGAITIDFATLTGAVISAIGHIHTGLFTENDSLSDLFNEVGKESGDTVWRLPLSDDYSHFLESSVADMNNLCLGQGAGATNGAIFLREFAPKENWVHLDIAGTSDHNGGTGRPVSLIAELFEHL